MCLWKGMVKNMNDLKLDNVEETLFVPMRGRVFASNKFPHILNDKKALEIADKLPKSYMSMERESEYTLMASAVRSMNMDKLIQGFLKKNPEGTIINVGAGMETTFYRNDNGKAIWYEIDLEEVTNMRKKVFGENDRDIVLTYSMFDYEWINVVMKNSKAPYLIVSAGVFYYFEKDAVIEFLQKVQKLGNVEVIFDTVSKLGMKGTRKYMKQLGKSDAVMYFYVEDSEDLVKEIGNGAKVIDDYKYYSFVDNKKGLKFSTKISMSVSDLLHMVKLIHLKLK